MVMLAEPLEKALDAAAACFARFGLARTSVPDIARELGVNLRSTSGPTITRPGDLAAILTNLRAGDILFIDEIHRLRPIIEEFLYPAMEDYRIDIRLSEGPKAQTITMPSSGTALMSLDGMGITFPVSRIFKNQPPGEPHGLILVAPLVSSATPRRILFSFAEASEAVHHSPTASQPWPPGRRVMTRRGS